MSGGLVLAKRDPSGMENPPAGKVRLFVNDDGQLCAMDETGQIVAPEELVSSVEAALSTEASARGAAEATLTAAAAAAKTTADAALPKAGGTMTGDIVLKGDPTANLHPATKQYVAAQIANVIAGAPGALDTLKEISDQLATDESAASALVTTVSGKLAKASNLSDVADATTARSNLSAASAASVVAETAARESAINIINLGTNWSEGDLVSGQLAHNVAGIKLDMRHGTSTAPVTAAQPSLKVSRIEKGTRAAIGAITGNNASDGAAGLAAIAGNNKGVAGSQVQSVGVFGGALNESSYEGEDGPDAVGLYGIGRITGGTSTLASCYGLVAYGRRDVNTAVINGAEIGALNYTATAEAYNPNGSGKARGIWLVAGGEADSGVGLTINNPFGFQFDVGIGFGNTEVGGKKGGVASASIRDDSSSTRSILVKGTHSKAAIAVALGSGPVVIGEEEAANPSALFEILGGAESRDPLYVYRTTGSTNCRGQLAANGSGVIAAFAAGGANSLLTGTALGDSGLTFAAGKIFHVGAGGKTSQLRIGEASIGFFGKTPVARPNVKAASEVTAKELCEALETLGLVE